MKTLDLSNPELPLEPKKEEFHYTPRRARSSTPLLIIFILFLMGITAFFAYYLGQNSAKVVKEIVIPSPPEIAVPTASVVVYPTATPSIETKTYQDTTNGFEFQYSTKDIHRLICKGEEQYGYFTQYQMNQDPVYMDNCARDGRFNLEVMAYTTTPQFDERYTYETKNIKVGGENATFYTFKMKPDADGPGEQTYISVFLPHKGKTIEFYLRSLELRSSFDQILSTFKFIDSSHADWKTYTNTVYNFSVSYPSNYRVLTDKDSLSGWPDAVALLYNGGQAYDLAIEVWNSEAEYRSKYGQGNFKFTVVEHNGKFFTLLNSTEEPQNAEIISTFKFTN